MTEEKNKEHDNLIEEQTNYFVKSSIKAATGIRPAKFPYTQLSLKPIRSLFKIKSIKRPTSVKSSENQTKVSKNTPSN